MYLVWNIITSCIQFIIPLILIIYLYFKIWQFLRTRSSSETLSTVSRQRKVARIKRTNIMLGELKFIQGVPKKTGISVMAGVSKFFFSQIIFILLLDYGKIIEIFF